MVTLLVKATKLSKKVCFVMTNCLKTNILCLFVLIGIGITSCSRQQDPTKEMDGKVSQNAEANLVSDMASSQLIKDFVHDCDKLTSDYEAAFKKMSHEQRRDFDERDKLATQQKIAQDYLVVTAQQMENFNATQASRIKQIDAAYPSYAQLGEDQKAEVMAKVISMASKGGSIPSAAGGGCSAGYKSCMSGCGGGTCADACWAGYKACLAIMYPAP